MGHRGSASRIQPGPSSTHGSAPLQWVHAGYKVRRDARYWDSPSCVLREETER
jgi:hypothetical protein